MIIACDQRMNEINKKILAKTEKLAREERRITTEILECLREVEEKMIYAELAYSSMYEFCIGHLKYSEGAAHRRISAMRLLKNLPTEAQESTKSKIENGTITVSNLSLLHGFFRVEKKECGKIYSSSEKVELLSNIENCSKLEAERHLAVIQPKIIPQEFKRVLTDNMTEIRFVAPDELMKKLQRAREIASHSLPFDAGIADLILKIADDFLNRHDPMLKFERKIATRRLVSREANPSVPSRGDGC